MTHTVHKIEREDRQPTRPRPWFCISALQYPAAFYTRVFELAQASRAVSRGHVLVDPDTDRAGIPLLETVD